MPSTAPSIHSLPPDERRAEYAAASDRAMEAAMDAAREYKARKPDPRSVHDYRGWHTMGLVCVLVVQHQPKPASIECSRDGGHYTHLYLPFSKIILQPETTDDFALVVIPKWLAQKANLMGVTPALSDARPWTDVQQKTWDGLGRLRSTINTKIYYANRRPASVLSRSAVA
jgi:hypothetical protein